MKDKFRNKYRIQSNRMPGWDYAGKGVYYITFVTQNRICNLGEVVVNQDGKVYVQLSDFGKIAETEFLKSFEIRQELYLDEYIIMPNHLHAIIELRKPTGMPTDEIASTHDGDIAQTHGGDIGDDIETHGRVSLSATNTTPATTTDTILANTTNKNDDFYRKPKSISSFVAGYKSVINSKIDDYIDEHNLDIPKYNRNNHFFQPNYYDHIIRNNNEYWRIKFYIENNPKNWVNDKFNKR